MSKKKVVAYARVSSGSDEQLHSYAFQSEYWEQRLATDPEIEYVGLYADKGISGRSMYKRPQFLIMMQDARDGKFDVIYTKSISRFSRNTTDLLTAVRELRDLGIEVIFENENIHSLSPTSEVYMTIAAALAENELREDSIRQRWSYQHRFENGWISFGTKMYGYRLGKDNSFVIEENEAAVIRRIFDMYIAGSGAAVISRVLNKDGLRNASGNRWSANNILEVIANEKYAGDALMGKHVRINGVHMQNKGGKLGAQYFVEGSHEGIVSHEVFERAQEARRQRQSPKMLNRQFDVREFTGMVFCGECGTSYSHKVNASGTKYQADIWACRNQLHNTVEACGNTRIKDSVLKEKFVEAYNAFVIERPQGNSVKAMENELHRLQQDERELGALAVKHLIPEKAYRTEQARLKAQIAYYSDKIVEQRSAEVKPSDYKVIECYDPEKVKKFITKVIVNKGTVTFVFYNGVEITLEYTNGRSGNKPGWNKKKEEA